MNTINKLRLILQKNIAKVEMDESKWLMGYFDHTLYMTQSPMDGAKIINISCNIDTEFNTTLIKLVDALDQCGWDMLEKGVFSSKPTYLRYRKIIEPAHIFGSDQLCSNHSEFCEDSGLFYYPGGECLVVTPPNFMNRINDPSELAFLTFIAKNAIGIYIEEDANKNGLNLYVKPRNFSWLDDSWVKDDIIETEVYGETIRLSYPASEYNKSNSTGMIDILDYLCTQDQVSQDEENVYYELKRMFPILTPKLISKIKNDYNSGDYTEVEMCAKYQLSKNKIKKIVTDKILPCEIHNVI